MKPTEILMQEHRVIEQVLDCLEIIAQRSDTEEELDLEPANQAVDFFRNFADRCHHGKEEECLFPLLEKKGFSPEQGPTSVMRLEHEAGREHVRGMAKASAAIAAGDASAKASFVSHAQAFVQLLREHIQKEDQCLFQMADKVLNEQEQLKLLESFARVEHDDMGQGIHEKYLDIAAGLAKRFDVECHASGSTPGTRCCGHH